MMKQLSSKADTMLELKCFVVSFSPYTSILWKWNIFYTLQVSAIENTQDHKSDLKISPVGYLIKFSDKGHSEVILDYDSETGLLTSKADPTSGVSHSKFSGIILYS